MPSAGEQLWTPYSTNLRANRPRPVPLRPDEPLPTMPGMDWKQAIAHWRSLPPQERQRRRWAAIPRNVARSMAFEGEPVSLEALEAEHARHPMPRVAVEPPCGMVNANPLLSNQPKLTEGMTMGDKLTLDQLTKLVDGEAVAIRGHAKLAPAGGAGDKVFPPTHSVEDRRRDPGAKYAREKRVAADGSIVDCVLLDSVQSQANRMEEALQGLWKSEKIVLPVITVDLSKVAPDVGEVTSLSAPHRIADALLRDSLHEGTFFRLSSLGRSFTDASPRQAAALFKTCPTGLIFGIWDSTGPKGGLGAKFARALSSEIVAVDVAFGTKTESRIDPTGIVKDSATIFVAKERDADGNATWTTDVMQAEPIDPAKPPQGPADVGLVKKWGKKEKAGKPSAIVHGNIAPSITELAGGVTMRYAEQTVVLSLAGLRRLGFGGAADTAARTVLAALALLAVVAMEQRGHDLRSRCLLVPIPPDGALRLEAVARDGRTTPISLDLDEALRLYSNAVAALPKALAFTNWGNDEPLQPGKALATLVPSEKLSYLITESRRLAGSGAEVEDA